MRRVWTLVALAAAALSGTATTARADDLRGAPAIPTVRGGGAVTAVSIMPAGGKAEMVIHLSGSVEVRDFVLTKPHRIVLDLDGATLGTAARLYDRVQRGGITNVRYAQYTEDVVRVVLELDGPRQYTLTRGSNDVRVSVDGSGRFTAWHSTEAAPVVVAQTASQMDSTIVALVAAESEQMEPLTRPARRTATPAPQRSQQPRITVTYQDADIRDVIAAFAAFSGRTIVVGKGVEGKVTAEVRDQPWDVAMLAILQAQGLAAVEEQSGIIAVDSYQNILNKQASERLVTRLLTVNYARAGSLVETIRGLLAKDCGASGPGGAAGAAGAQGGGGCITRGSVSADSATNTLIVTEVESRIDDVIGYVRSLDVRTPQVAIKARIILIDRTEIEDMGIRYDLGGPGTFFNQVVQRPKTFEATDTDGDGIPDTRTPTENYNPDETVVTIGGNELAAVANANQLVAKPALSVVFSTMLGKFSLTSFLDALQSVQLADIQAEPSIVTLDNRKAEILSGEETPIRVIDASSAGGGEGGGPRATVNFKESGIMLSVTPHVTANRQVLMTLHAERSSLAIAASDVGFTFQKQRADNQLLVNDGETAVIGGLTVTQVTVAKEGIPLLVDLPLIGRLFGQTRTQQSKRDLLILVTPHIVDDGDVTSAPPGPSGR